MASLSMDGSGGHIGPPSDSDTRRTSTEKKEKALEVTHKITSTESAAADQLAPSRDVSSGRQRLSDIFTIICAGFALISDGYQNNLM